MTLPPIDAVHGSNRDRVPPRTWTTTAFVLALLGLMMAVPFSAVAQEPTETTPTETTPPPSSSGCDSPGTNSQCNGFGSIRMISQVEIRGTPVDIEVSITLNTLFPERNARWILFSMRNLTSEGESPVMIGLRGFSTPHGDIAATRTEQTKPSELNLWVDVLDLPVNTPITLKATIGARERGAYVLEMLVMPFDRGYTPISDSSNAPQSLYSFTLLGVNKETNAVSGAGDKDSLLRGNKIPALGTGLVVAAVACAAFGLARRRLP